jgi:hypothetical protein
VLTTHPFWCRGQESVELHLYPLPPGLRGCYGVPLPLPFRFSPFLQAIKALRERRGIALLCSSTSALEGMRVSVTPEPLSTPGKEPVPTVKESGWAPGPVWIGAGNLARTGIRAPDRPAGSQSPYRLSYPAHTSTQHACLSALHCPARHTTPAT